MVAVASAEPTALGPGDHSAYLDAIEQMGGGRPPDESEPREVDIEAVRKVLALEAVVGNSDPALAARIRAWLFERVPRFHDAYSHEAAKVHQLPKDSRWHRTERAWVAWLNRALPSLNEKELDELEWKVTTSYAPGLEVFPGLDRFALGLAIADVWIRAGHPPADRNRPAFDALVGGVSVDHGKVSAGSRWWHKEAIASEASTRRLAEAVLARRDGPFARFTALMIGRTPMTRIFLAELEKDAALWREALLAVSATKERAWMYEWLVADLRRVWKAHPDRRGVVLFALAQASVEEAPVELPDRLVPFLDFARDFGGTIGRAELNAFLDQHPRAIELVAWLMPARTRGLSVVDVVLPRLEAYFELPKDAPPDAPRAPGFERVVDVLCHREHDAAELAKLRGYFERRAPLHPGDPRNLLMERYTPKACRAR